MYEALEDTIELADKFELSLSSLEESEDIENNIIFKQNDNVLNIIEPDKIKGFIDRGCFKVMYQPKFKIQGDVAEIAGAEALVRLVINDAVIPPDDFIPALKKGG